MQIEKMCLQDIFSLLQIGWTCQKVPMVDIIWMNSEGFKLVIHDVHTTGTENVY
jgi:hypothetical protein